MKQLSFRQGMEEERTCGENNEHPLQLNRLTRMYLSQETQRCISWSPALPQSPENIMLSYSGPIDPPLEQHSDAQRIMKYVGTRIKWRWSRSWGCDS